ncbi:MAG: reverse transcriptase/maturase family protein [bacterium]|nr:reverse transcriptase/maturase family protein [bacterium]
MSKIQLVHTYQYIICRIFNGNYAAAAWQEFLAGKRPRRDVQEFEINLMSNIISLHNDLVAKRYQHSPYQAFNISDPKPRNIHKASVQDRLLHHAIYRVLYPFFDKIFIADSYSCRIDKGTHKAINRFRAFAYKASQNHTKTVWVLKCDIKKFFASIDQEVLISIINEYIPNQDIRWLINQIVSSFYSTEKGKGLPLGNLTSQLFVNVYMNKFDQFVKHKLNARQYIRYADDFVFMADSKLWLESLVPLIRDFLEFKLRLTLHPRKLFLKTLSSGVDFLGWVHFPDHRVFRTTARRRMIKCITENPTNETFQSYLGLLKHGNTKKIKSHILDR